MLTLSNWPALYVRGWSTTLKAYIDGLNTGKQDIPSLVPPVGYSQLPKDVLTTSNVAATYQSQFFYPVDVGPVGWTADALMVNVNGAYSGTTSPTMYGGLYANDPATGYPLTTAAGLLGSGSVVTTAAGVKAIPFASAVVLPTGRYWISTLLAGSAVTTAGSFTNIATMAPIIPIGAAVLQSAANRGLSLTGLSALKNTATAPSAFVINTGTGAAVASLRRSA